jgi:hypothetical protein
VFAKGFKKYHFNQILKNDLYEVSDYIKIGKQKIVIIVLEKLQFCVIFQLLPGGSELTEIRM